ncbi:GNAT family N-acetyltransferase [Candidatus Woesearchaeota archaeon]|nr:GNAT family N-acetyltransferase [Candidatus Woesearchaeota archaeon]USN44725.1 MAG: GNAT family N-acetyltransferase [Candidatus Woesearchaeota archaeon]
MIKIKELTKSKVIEVVAIYKEHDKKDSEIIKKVYTKFYSKPKKQRGTNIKDYILIEDKEIIGFSGFNKEETETKDIFWLNWTAIKKGHEQKGYGKILLKHILKELKKRKGRKLYVSTSSKNTNANEFYKSIGFNKEAQLKDYYKKGEDSIILSINV